MNRRAFLRDVALAASATALSARAAEPAPPAGFTHRALNGWITDLATKPDPHAGMSVCLTCVRIKRER